MPGPIQNVPVAPPFAILPLPPNEYDPVYMMTLIRSLTYILQQLANPGTVNGNTLTLFANRPYSGYNLTKDPDFTFNTISNDLTNDWVVRLLPQGAGIIPAGVVSNQIWIDTTDQTLKIAP